MALIDKNTGKNIEVEDVFFNINKIKVSVHDNEFNNSQSIYDEIGVYLQDEFAKIKAQLIAIGETKLLENFSNLVKEEDYIPEFPKEGELGYNYNHRFFFTSEQFIQAFQSYPGIMIELTNGTPNPIVLSSNGNMIYINNFLPGARELLVSNGIKVEDNLNKV